MRSFLDRLAKNSDLAMALGLVLILAVGGTWGLFQGSPEAAGKQTGNALPAQELRKTPPPGPGAVGSLSPGREGRTAPWE